MRLLCRLLISFSLLLNQPLSADDHKAESINPFISTPDFIIPIIQQRKLQEVYRFKFILELQSPTLSPTIDKVMPRLIDAIYTYLYGMLAVVWVPNYNVHLAQLKLRLLEVCEGVVGKEIIKDILVQEFSQYISEP